MSTRSRPGTGEAESDPRLAAARAVWAGGAGALQRLTGACRRFLLALVDGVAAARRYRRLSALSDAELARLRLTRKDVPWFAFSGERPPPPDRDSCQPGSPGAGHASSRLARRSEIGGRPAPVRRAA